MNKSLPIHPLLIHSLYSVQYIYEVYFILNTKYLLIPLFNVEISRFIPFWKGMDTAILLHKVKHAGNYQSLYERHLRYKKV